MNRDFRDLLAEFNVQGVDFIIVGAHALAATVISARLRISLSGSGRRQKMLNEFIAPCRSSERRYRISPKPTSQLQASFFRSALTPSASPSSLPSTVSNFPEAWVNRMSTKFDDQPASVLSKEDLIRNKRAAGRTQDLADLERLEGRGKKS
jgi:hypothetical protein